MEESRIASFLRSEIQPKTPYLEQLRKEAQENGVPIVKPETEALLSFFVQLLQPKQVLEVGTAIGYSGLSMLHDMPGDAHLTTMENYPPRIESAKNHFAEAGEEERVTLLEGDADEYLKTLSGPYDLIFMDAAKAQYIVWLPDILRLLAPSGVLISDNVFHDGEILESRYSIPRRDRTIHKRMREYLWELKHHPQLSTAVLPLGDGVAVTTWKKEGDA